MCNVMVIMMLNIKENVTINIFKKFLTFMKLM